MAGGLCTSSIPSLLDELGKRCGNVRTGPYTLYAGLPQVTTNSTVRTVFSGYSCNGSIC